MEQARRGRAALPARADRRRAPMRCSSSTRGSGSSRPTTTSSTSSRTCAHILTDVEKRGVPVIHFGVGTQRCSSACATRAATVIGVDWRTPLAEAWERVGHDRAVQGNLDPTRALRAARGRREARAARPRRGGRPAGPHLQPRPRHLAGDAGRQREGRRRLRAHATRASVMTMTATERRSCSSRTAPSIARRPPRVPDEHPPRAAAPPGARRRAAPSLRGHRRRRRSIDINARVARKLEARSACRSRVAMRLFHPYPEDVLARAGARRRPARRRRAARAALGAGLRRRDDGGGRERGRRGDRGRRRAELGPARPSSRRRSRRASSRRSPTCPRRRRRRARHDRAQPARSRHRGRRSLRARVPRERRGGRRRRRCARGGDGFAEHVVAFQSQGIGTGHRVARARTFAPTLEELAARGSRRTSSSRRSAFSPTTSRSSTTSTSRRGRWAEELRYRALSKCFVERRTTSSWTALAAVARDLR